jgi:hypothetical protein
MKWLNSNNRIFVFRCFLHRAIFDLHLEFTHTVNVNFTSEIVDSTYIFRLINYSIGEYVQLETRVGNAGITEQFHEQLTEHERQNQLRLTRNEFPLKMVLVSFLETPKMDRTQVPKMDRTQVLPPKLGAFFYIPMKSFPDDSNSNSNSLDGDLPASSMPSASVMFQSINRL